MTIVLASILLFIMMATLMPVYDIIGQLKL